MPVKNCVTRNAVVVHARLERRRRNARHDLVYVLREPGDGQIAGALRNLAALVQIDGGELLAENLLGALLVVQPAEPDLRAVGKLGKPVGTVQPVRHVRESRAHDCRERVLDDRVLDVVEPEAQDRMPAARGLQSPHNDVASQQIGLAAAAAAEQHDVRGGARQNALRLLLLGGELHSA